jgi:cytochrome c-type biogenesis protein CcmH/NrfG
VNQFVNKVIAVYTVKIKPDTHETFYHHGFAHYNKGDLDRAIADWEAVLWIDPTNINLKQIIEIVRQQRGR